MSRRTGLRLIGVVAIAFGLGGCLSPTLPLPPPSRPDVTAPNDDGMIHISGVVPSGSEVFAKNRRTLHIVGQETDTSGRYDLLMEAEVDDRIIVWYTSLGAESEFAEVNVPAKDSIGQGGASGN